MEAAVVPRAGALPGFKAASARTLKGCSDERLVALARAGSPGAFEALYDRYHRGIVSFCRHLLGDPFEAEDAAQQVFLSAYNDLVGSRKPILLRAWLFRIARNRCYSIVRSRREHPTGELGEISIEGLAAQVQRREELRDLVGDLQGLPLEQRAALVLSELDALSHDEIASALGVPRAKVKALVFQARQSLMATRAARNSSCSEIQAELSSARGGALRRAHLRRHLRVCPGCRQYRREVERQRRRLSLALPVAPTLALKQAVLAGTVGVGAAAGIAGGGWLAAGALKSGFFKGVLAVLLAGAGTAGTVVASEQFGTAPPLSSVAHNLLARGSGRSDVSTAPRPPSASPAPAGMLSPLSSLPVGHSASRFSAAGAGRTWPDADPARSLGGISGSVAPRGARRSASRVPGQGSASGRPLAGGSSIRDAGSPPAARRVSATGPGPGGSVGGSSPRPSDPGSAGATTGPGSDPSAGPGSGPGGQPGSGGPSPRRPAGPGQGGPEPAGPGGGPGEGPGGPGGGPGGPGGGPGGGSGGGPAGPGGGPGGPGGGPAGPGGGPAGPGGGPGGGSDSGRAAVPR